MAPSFKYSFKHISSVQWVSLLTDASNHVVAAVTEIESLQEQREYILALPVPNRPSGMTNVCGDGKGCGPGLTWLS